MCRYTFFLFFILNIDYRGKKSSLQFYRSEHLKILFFFTVLIFVESSCQNGNIFLMQNLWSELWSIKMQRETFDPLSLIETKFIDTKSCKTNRFLKNCYRKKYDVNFLSFVLFYCYYYYFWKVLKDSSKSISFFCEHDFGRFSVHSRAFRVYR